MNAQLDIKRSETGIIKVLHLVHAFQTGGAERIVLDLTRHADSSVANYVCSLREPNDLASRLDPGQTGFRCLNKKEGNDLGVITALASLIDEERIDVVHAQGWGTFLEGLVAAKYRAGRRPRFIFAFHGKTMEDVTQGVPLRRRLAQRIAHLWTDACIAPARHMADEYARSVGLSRERIVLIHNGIDVSRFGRELYPEARTAFNLSPEDFVVGFAGRLDPVKNVPGILETFTRFRKRLGADKDRARLLIVGDGTARTDAEQRAAALGVSDRVVFAGLRSDVPECMAAMDVYLQPSHYEGQSVTILEALATGLPVISTAVGGTPEIIRHGSDGFLFHPHEYGAMSQTLHRLFRQPELAAAVGRRGRERVVRHFSVGKMVEGYEQLYRRLLMPGGRSCAA